MKSDPVIITDNERAEVWDESPADEMELVTIIGKQRPDDVRDRRRTQRRER